MQKENEIEIEKIHVTADISIMPLGVGLSLSSYISACEEVLKSAGLKTHLHAFGTNVEGSWDEVMTALRKCHQVIHQMGAPRVHTTLKLGTRVDREETIQEKIESVQEKMKE